MKAFLLFLMSCCATAAFAQPASDTSLYGRNPKTGQHLKLRGINMYYERYGKGEPLLIIHGNGGSIDNFRYQIPYFEKTYGLILADSRGHGQTPDDGDSLSYEMMADDYAALLEDLNIDSANVIGWSDGGIIGLLLAIRHPKKVKMLAITGANLSPDTSAVHPFAYHWAQNYNKQLASQKINDTVKAMRKQARLLSNEPNISPATLKNVKCPTLVISGDQEVILAKHTLLIAQHIPKANLWIVPNSGHSVPITYKDEFNKNVDRFFKTAYKKITAFGLFQ
ncbi:MAG: alpha/beta hydrolase [Chitinophagaceae bacterium]|nr:MAG: alpha/beta hydrolase [Chitinophagaceae bacterium]